MALKSSKARRSRFWLVAYSSAWKRVMRFIWLPTTAVPATAPTSGSAKCRVSRVDGVGHEEGVGINGNDHLGVGQVDCEIERGSLAAV